MAREIEEATDFFSDEIANAQPSISFETLDPLLQLLIEEDKNDNFDTLNIDTIESMEYETGLAYKARISK